MNEEFKDYTFTEISHRNVEGSGTVIKAEDAQIVGSAKINVEQESHDGVKVILKKDDSDNVKEIKFVCSCGETKSVLLDYSD
jgi:hypothetical protein